MLGLLALVLATLISFNQQRVTKQAYKSTIRDELELAASGTAQHVMEMIAARSYDEVSTPVVVFRANGVPYGADTFTDGGHFGSHGTAPEDCDLMTPANTPDCNDVDDMDGIRDAPVEARLSDGRTLAFTADVDVSYVTDPGSQTPSSAPTLHKRVDLTIHSAHPAAPVRGMVAVSRVVSYDPIKADADMESLCGPIGVQGSECRPGGSAGTGTVGGF